MNRGTAEQKRSKNEVFIKEPMHYYFPYSHAFWKHENMDKQKHGNRYVPET